MPVLTKSNKTWGYVIYHKSGTSLFDRDVDTISEERCVLTNMINTLIKSSQIGTTVPIEELETSKTNILLSKTSGLPIWHAVFCDKSQNKNIGYKLLGKLIDQFERLYSEAQEKKIVANFFKYQEFADQVSEIIDSLDAYTPSNTILNTYAVENKKDNIMTFNP